MQDCIFEDRNMQADAEVTGEFGGRQCDMVLASHDRCFASYSLAFLAVLAAFAHWAEHNLPDPLDQTGTERVVAICSRIRFPSIPAGMLQLYW